MKFKAGLSDLFKMKYISAMIKKLFVNEKHLLIILGTLVPLFILSSCARHGATAISRSLPAEQALVSNNSLPKTSTPATSQRALPTPPRPQSVYFDWPVDSARMTRGFLPTKKRPHNGLDLAAPKGTAILASRGGTVIYRGHDFRGYGKMILIESDDGWATLYAHLDRFLVQQGQRVVTGELLGTMGTTGRSTGVHLHFEIRKNKVPLDPLDLLPAGRELSRQASL